MEKEEISENIRVQYNDLIDLDDDKNPDIEYLIQEKQTNKKGKEKNSKKIFSFHFFIQANVFYLMNMKY